LQRSLDRMESQGLEYLEQVRQGFLKEAERFPHHVVVLNADQPQDLIHAEVMQQVTRALTSDV
jgi:dTMP kinase